MPFGFDFDIERTRPETFRSLSTTIRHYRKVNSKLGTAQLARMGCRERSMGSSLESQTHTIYCPQQFYTASDLSLLLPAPQMEVEPIYEATRQGRRPMDSRHALVDTILSMVTARARSAPALPSCSSTASSPPSLAYTRREGSLSCKITMWTSSRLSYGSTGGGRSTWGCNIGADGTETGSLDAYHGAHAAVSQSARFAHGRRRS